MASSQVVNKPQWACMNHRVTLVESHWLKCQETPEVFRSQNPKFSKSSIKLFFAALSRTIATWFRHILTTALLQCARFQERNTNNIPSTAECQSMVGCELCVSEFGRHPRRRSRPPKRPRQLEAASRLVPPGRSGASWESAAAELHRTSPQR